jgi:DNA replication initiation complex subunit (GINS family)
MSQQTLTDSQEVTEQRHVRDNGADPTPVVGIRRHDVAGILAQMTFRERIRAYEKGVFTRHELSTAAAREPDRMPLLNGEFEWIAAFLADLD